MTARIDHYAEMLDALEVGKHAASNEFAAVKFAEAQVHATAYAAEQARIGNLIAYMVKLSSHPTNVEELHPTDVADFQASVDIIRAGLGLS